MTEHLSPAEHPDTAPAEIHSWRSRRTHSRGFDPYVAGLHDEWSRLAAGLEREPDVLSLLDQARRSEESSLSCIDTLDDLVAAMRHHGDRPLLFALEAAQQGSYIGARSIIQTMLPKLARLTNSIRRGRDFGSVMPDAVAAMYEVICRYPIDRRPRSVAANLALDTLKALRKFLGTELPSGTLAVPQEYSPSCFTDRYSSASRTDASTSDELAEVLALAQHRRLISDADVRLLWLVATGGTAKEVAGHVGMTPATVRQRYSRACATLRSHAPMLTA